MIPSLLATLLVAPVPVAATRPWEPLIAEAAHRFALPAGWIRQVLIAESGGRTTLARHPIRSPKGAIGLMQLMPATWQAMQVAYGLGPDPDDPRANILAGAAYLARMRARFGYPGLFAAYNAGPARYADHLARGTPLPAETRAYLAAMTGGRAPASIAVTPQPPRLFAVAPALFEANSPARSNALFAVDKAGR